MAEFNVTFVNLQKHNLESYNLTRTKQEQITHSQGGYCVIHPTSSPRACVQEIFNQIFSHAVNQTDKTQPPWCLHPEKALFTINLSFERIYKLLSHKSEKH
jgi:hypothetical protein